MEQPQPTGSGELTGAGLLVPYARRLLGVSVTRLWRLVTVSPEATIPLLGTLVLETEPGFVTLSYTQQGLSCHGPMPRSEIRWNTEPDLPMGRTPDAEEWLDLGPLEDQPAAPRLPLFVHTVTGWFGVGPYTDTFALILAGQGGELVFMTTDAFDLQSATRQEARHRAELVAANMDLRLVDQELRLCWTRGPSAVLGRLAECLPVAYRIQSVSGSAPRIWRRGHSEVTDEDARDGSCVECWRADGCACRRRCSRRAAGCWHQCR